jgi:hypothetical protein
MITRDYYDAKLRLGLGYSREAAWNKKNETDASAIDSNKLDSAHAAAVANIVGLKRNFIVLQESKYVSESYGPELGLALNVRAGGWGVARGDFRVRIPLDNYRNPDWDINATLSWMLTRSVTLDYIFLYTYRHPKNPLAWAKQWTNSIFLRFSLSSR